MNDGFTINGELPLGLGMALAQNINAMEYFAGQSDEQKQQIVEGAHNVRSKAEMRQYVSDMAKSSFRR